MMRESEVIKEGAEKKSETLNIEGNAESELKPVLA